jgi:hypothetical protein
MGKRVDVEQLVGTKEIAERLRIKRPHLVHDWRRRYTDFPEPLARVSGVILWLWPDIERWARRTGRL